MQSFLVITVQFILICCACQYNILWLQSDEMDGRVLDPRSQYWDIVSMPNLRALASNGINFVNNYCNSPLCAPSRTSMWSGRYVNNILAWSNVKSLTAQVDNPSLPDRHCEKIVGYGSDWCIQMGKKQNVTTTIKQSMIAAGYNVTIWGKMDTGGGMGTGYHTAHNGNWSTLLNGSCSNETTNNYCPGDIIHSWSRHANVTKGEYLPPWEGDWINIKSHRGGFFEVIDEPVMLECLNFLESYYNESKTQKAQKPFLLYCSMLNPHPPYWSNKTWFKYLNYTTFNKTFSTMIENFNGKFNTMHPADKYNSITESVGDIDINQEWAYNLWQAYFATCAELDYRMGKIINKLKSYPKLYENTLILYTSDHGEMHLEHLQLEKMSMYEPSARVPLIVSGPNIPVNKIITNYTSLVDIFPTYLDTANISYNNEIYPKDLNGYSLSTFFNWSWINNNSDNPYLKRPDYAFSEYHGEQTNTAQYMLRQNQYKLILYATNPPFQSYKPQLFDINNDPFELNNIAEQNNNIVENMTNIINDILMKTGGGDYNFVDDKCQEEGRKNFLRWQSEINGNITNLWINYTNATYTSLTQNDLQKLIKWSNQ